MIRSQRIVSTLALSLVCAVAAATLGSSTAMAKPPKPFPVFYPYHHHDHVYFGGVYVGGPTYVATAEPVANQALYTLYFKDNLGQTKVYGQYTATMFENGATNWGGLLAARDALKAAGVECWVSAGQWIGTTAE